MRSVEHARHIGALRHVDRERACVRAERRRHPLAIGGITVGDQHLRTFSDELLRDAFAETGAAAGDDRHFAFKPHR